MLRDANNGMLEAWVIMAVEVVLVSASAFYYEAVRSHSGGPGPHQRLDASFQIFIITPSNLPSICAPSLINEKPLGLRL